MFKQAQYKSALAKGLLLIFAVWVTATILPATFADQEVEPYAEEMEPYDQYEVTDPYEYDPYYEEDAYNEGENIENDVDTEYGDAYGESEDNEDEADVPGEEETDEYAPDGEGEADEYPGDDAKDSEDADAPDEAEHLDPEEDAAEGDEADADETDEADLDEEDLDEDEDEDADDEEEDEDEEESTRTVVDGLLVLTQEEFDEIERDELESYGVGILPNISAFNSGAAGNTCPNLIEDGTLFATNVIVDGVVCVGDLAGFVPFVETNVTDGGAFVSAWNNANTTIIHLMGNITVNGNGTVNNRQTNIRVEGNGHQLIFSNAGGQLILGPSTQTASRLDFRDVQLGRTNNSTTPMITAQNAAASSSWTVFFHDDVRTVAGNRSGLLNLVNATVYVTGRRNVINVDNTTATVTALNVQGVTVGAEVIDASTGASPAGLEINMQNSGVAINTTNTTVANSNGFVDIQGESVVTVTQAAGTAVGIHTGDMYLGADSYVELERTGGHGTGIRAEHVGGTRPVSRGEVILGQNAHLEVTTVGTGHGIHAHDLILYEGSQPVNHASPVRPCEQDVNTTTVIVNASGASHAAVRITASSSFPADSTGSPNGNANDLGQNQITMPANRVPDIAHDHRPGVTPESGRTGFSNSRTIIHENARVCIENTGTNRGVPDDTESFAQAAIFQRSDGVVGNIGEFVMHPNSTMDIRAGGTGFRNYAQRSLIEMSGGANARIYNLGNAAGTNGSPAFILAQDLDSGAHGSAVARTQLTTRRRRRSRHIVRMSGEGTLLHLEGYVSRDVPGTISNRGNAIIAGDNSLFLVDDHAELRNISHNSTAILFFGEAAGFFASNHAHIDVYVGGSASASAAAVRFLQTHNEQLDYGATFVAETGAYVSLRATGDHINHPVRQGSTGGTAALLRAFGGATLFETRTGGVLEFHHDGPSGAGIDFASGNTCPAEDPRCAQADRFIVNGYRSEILMRVANGPAVLGSNFFDTGIPAGARSNHSNVTVIEARDGAIFDVVASVSSAAVTMPHGGSPSTLTPAPNGSTANVQLGVFNAGRMHMLVENPLYVDFTNAYEARTVNGVPTSSGLIFFTVVDGVDDPTRSTLRANGASLALWRNDRAGDFLHVSGVTGAGGFDDLNGDAAMTFHNTNFLISASATGFRNADLIANQLDACPDFWIVGQGYTKCAWDGFRDWFNTSGALPQTGSTTTLGGTGAGTNAGWAQIRRMNMNNAAPIVDVLRTPTDADARIWGHVSIQQGNRGARSAIANEVFVDLNVYNADGDLMHEILHAPTGTHSIYGDAEHHGVFMTEVLFDLPVGTTCPERLEDRGYFREQANPDGTEYGAIVNCDFFTDRTEQVIHVHEAFDAETQFLPAGYTVEVVMARRTGTAQGFAAGVAGRGVDGVTGATPRYRQSRWTCRPQDTLCHDDRLFTAPEVTRAVTPPEIVSDVVVMIDGYAVYDGYVTPGVTSIEGTGQPGATVHVARVSTVGADPVAVTGVTSWLDGYATVADNGEWEFAIPTGTTFTHGEFLSIYITDNIGFTPGGTAENLRDLGTIGVADLPEVIERRYPGDTTLNSRVNVVAFSELANLRTVHTGWAGAGRAHMGNIGFHHGQRTAFHDAQNNTATPLGLDRAIGEDLRFHYAYLLEVVDLVQVDFRWNFAGAPSDGRFHLDTIVPGETATAPANNPQREPETAGQWVFTGWATTPGGGVAFNFNTPLYEATNVYAQWEWDPSIAELTVVNLPTTAGPIGTGPDNQPIQLPPVGQVASGPRNIGSTFAMTPGTSEHFEFLGWVRIAGPNSHPTPTLGMHIQDIAGLILPTTPPYALTMPSSDVTYMALWGNNGRIGGVNFEFTKTTNVLTAPLAGAFFNLYRENDQGGWDLVAGCPVVGEASSWQASPDCVQSAANGLVNLDGVMVAGGRYRLVETAAPVGFDTPNGHWIIEVNADGSLVDAADGAWQITTIHPGAAPASCPLDGGLPNCTPDFAVQGGALRLPNVRTFIPDTGLGGVNMRAIGLLIAGLLGVATVSYRRMKLKRKDQSLRA